MNWKAPIAGVLFTAGILICGMVASAESFFYGNSPLVSTSRSPENSSQPLKVYILAGQSNMQGAANISTFDYIGLDPATAPMLKEMRGADGEPRVCERVWISLFGGQTVGEGEMNGRLTAGYGANDQCIGPEFTFGIYLQKLLDQPILLIKTAWGGKSLNTDFRPPSAGPYTLPRQTLDLFLERPGGHGIPEDLDQWKTEKAAQTGHYYRLMIGHVKKVLADPKSVYPHYDPDQGYELAGFVWFQGWNDMCDGQTYPEGDKYPTGFKLYTDLMVHFIRDVRNDLNAPDMPFVIGTIGVHGDKATGRIANLRPAMAAPAAMPEFNANVTAVDTGQFWDHEMEAMEPKLSDLNRLRDSAHIIANDGTMEKRKPGTPDWEPVGRPSPERRVWRYTSFDPQEENDKMHNKRERKRFRDVILPVGLEGWEKPEFDDSKWMSGRAPIGKGVWPYPGGTRNVTVKNVSDWGSGEFILMRTTFEVDRLDYDSYRLSILARQGFHVYLNGYKIHTYIWWKDAPYYRSIVLEPEHVAHMKTGVNVLAAYSPVHYDNTQQPYASIDLAIEGLPADAKDYVNSTEYMRKRMSTVFTPREQELLSGASNAAYHYMGSGKMMAQIGKAFAEAMLGMEKR
jgi:alpha-galactosidase